MTTFATSRPGIKVRVLPRYPAAVEATPPIAAAVSNGKLLISYDSSPLADAAPVDPATARIVVREGSSYKESTVNDILGAAPSMAAMTVKSNLLSTTGAVANNPVETLGNALGLAITRSDIPNLYIPGNSFTVDGFLALGDRGSDALYVRGTSTGLMAIQDALGTWWNLKLNGTINVGWFGAVGDGVTDDALAIQAAIDAAYDAGGGEVLIPAGTYIVGYVQSSLTQRAALFLKDKVWLRGEGVNATTLSLKDAADAHVIFGRALVDARVSSMTIYGNRGNQSTPVFLGYDPCGILIATSATNCLFENLFIDNTLDYGIGIQVGTAKGNTLQNIVIDRAGADGIDFKNTDNASENNRIHNFTVKRFGLQGETGEIFAGLDIRGKGTLLTNIRVEQLGYNKGTSGRDGIRFNIGGGGIYVTTGGAQASSLSNFYIEGDGTTYIADLTVRGLCLLDDQVAVSNGTIINVGTGICRAQRDCALSNIIVDNCRRGLIEDSTLTAGGGALPTYPAYGAASGLIIRGCSDFGIRFEEFATDNSYVNCQLISNGYNVSMHPGASRNTFIGGSFLTPVTSNVTGANETNVFARVNGYTGSVNFGAPVTKSGNFTLAVGENWIINTKAGSNLTVTLPAASTCTGRVVTFKTTVAFSVVSASSNVVPAAGGAAGTTITGNVAGNWATVVSDGTSWVIMAS